MESCQDRNTPFGESEIRFQSKGDVSTDLIQKLVQKIKHSRLLAERRKKVTDRHWNKREVDRFIPKNINEVVKDVRVQTHTIEMADGTKITADVILPPIKLVGENAKLPCVFHQTRYYRQWRPRGLLRMLESFPVDPINIAFKKGFAAAGFAVVSMDVRGTGASFGQWRAPCTSKEREDSVEVLNWIGEQAFCNGEVFLYGISYDAMAALFTASCKHPSVKGCAALFTFWDVYSDIGVPGGVTLHYFFDNWNKLINALDSGKLSEAPKPIAEAFVAGFKGVKGKTKELARKAIADHNTVNVSKALRQVMYRDDVPAELGIKVDMCSPYSKYEDIRDSNIPMLIVSGWLDGSARSSINMICHAAKAEGSRLLIGPWTHGGVQHVGLGSQLKSRFSKFHKQLLGRSKLVAEVVKYFTLCKEHQLAAQSASLPKIIYFTMNAPDSIPNWQESNTWPPNEVKIRPLFLNFAEREGEKGQLQAFAASGESERQFEVKDEHSPSGYSRFHTMIFIGDLLHYKRKEKCGHVHVDSSPLSCHLEVTGSPYMSLWMSSTDTDADIIVYLEDYDPVSNKVNYVTEGIFRASHRKTYRNEECHSHVQSSLIPGVPFWHSYVEEDQQPLVPNAPTEIKFELMPTSYCFQKGSCLRLSFSGSDSSHYLHTDNKGSRSITLYAGQQMKSCIYLPQKLHL